MQSEDMNKGLALSLLWQKRLQDGTFDFVTEEVHWDPIQTAVIICDMWDQHWCKAASERVGEMASHLNEVVMKLREKGTFIIHAPSDTLKYYEHHPARLTALNAPRIETEEPLQNWVRHDIKREGVFPIDDSDGGCGCEPRCLEGKLWSHQHEAIVIMNEDAITDNFEAIYLLKQRCIKNVLIMGVHTNMCVLGRPFGIRQLVTQGFHVVLLRDLTDTMYNPKMWPYVDHFSGTDLVLQHIERYWCPTISSNQIIGEPFRFKGNLR